MQLLASLLLAAWGLLGSSSQAQDQGPPVNPPPTVVHDGSTVTMMLARQGLGPAASSSHTGRIGVCEGRDHAACSEVPKDMCWGYEKGCSNTNRLFVPKCEGPSSPW